MYRRKSRAPLHKLNGFIGCITDGRFKASNTNNSRAEDNLDKKSIPDQVFSKNAYNLSGCAATPVGFSKYLSTTTLKVESRELVVPKEAARGFMAIQLKPMSDQ